MQADNSDVNSQFTPAQSNNSAPAPKSGKGKIIAVIAVVILVLALGGVAIFFALQKAPSEGGEGGNQPSGGQESGLDELGRKKQTEQIAPSEEFVDDSRQFTDPSQMVQLCDTGFYVAKAEEYLGKIVGGVNCNFAQNDVDQYGVVATYNATGFPKSWIEEQKNSGLTDEQIDEKIKNFHVVHAMGIVTVLKKDKFSNFENSMKSMYAGMKYNMKKVAEKDDLCLVAIVVNGAVASSTYYDVESTEEEQKLAAESVKIMTDWLLNEKHYVKQ